MTKILNRKNIVVVGGLTGVGRAFIPVAIKEGARVVNISRTAAGDAKVKELYAECNAIQKGSVKHFVADATDKDQIVAAMDKAAKFLGGIDALVCAIHNVDAGIPTEDLPEDRLLGCLRANFFGDLFCCQAAFPYMKNGGGGSIVTFSANAAFNITGESLPYVAAKYGVVALTRMIANEWNKYGIRANNVMPLSTTASTTFHPAHLDPVIYEKATNTLKPILVHPELNPWDRVAAPVYVAYLVAYLCSDMSYFVTDQVIHHDGGASRSCM